MVLWRRLLIAACVFAGGLAASSWVRSLALAERGNRARMGFEMGGIEVGVLAIAIALAIALPGSVPRRLGLQPSRLSLWAFAAVVLGTLGLSLAMNALVDATAVAEGSNMTGISRGLAAPPDARSIWIAVFGTALLPGIAEELLCRGVVQRSLVAWIHPVVAIAVSTLLFGALHMELVHGGVAFLIGSVPGSATAYWSDSTRPAIAAHIANNGLALAGLASGWLPDPRPPTARCCSPSESAWQAWACGWPSAAGASGVAAPRATRPEGRKAGVVRTGRPS